MNADKGELELHVVSPTNTRDPAYHAAGVVRIRPMPSEQTATSHNKSPSTTNALLDGGSVRIRSLATGLVEEAFLDAQGAFAQELELEPETDNALEWTVCDADGRECGPRRHGCPPSSRWPTDGARRPADATHCQDSEYRSAEPWSSAHQANGRPVGAALPGVFQCVCRTSDRSGRIVVPIYEENRVVQQLVIENLDPSLPVGSAVEVEFAIDCKHVIEVSVRVHGVNGVENRCEKATIEPPPLSASPHASRPRRGRTQLQDALEQLTGRLRARLRTRAAQVRDDLLEALSYDDEPRAIQRMAELRDLLLQAELARSQMLDPPWPRFAQLVRHCLDLAAEVSSSTGRDREDLFQHVHAQDRYAEQAYEDHNQALYRECWENLSKYAGYLAQLLRDGLPRPSARPRARRKRKRAMK